MKPGICKFLSIMFFLLLQGTLSWAQEADMTATENKPVKNTFSSIWVIDNQSVMVPLKGTFEFDLQHRFGLVYNGYEDFWGLYAPSNIRLGFGFVPIDKLMVGFGITKRNLTWDFNAKYAIFKQMKSGGMPLSVTYFVNAAADTRDKIYFTNPEALVTSDRFSYFHQILLARKFSDKLSVQLAGSLSHFNTVDAFKNDNVVIKKWNNDHLAVAVSARYKLSNTMNFLFNYDQPLTTHVSIDPKPNFSFGLEISTSAHQFQVFFGNFDSITPQRNNVFNTNWGFGKDNHGFAEWDPQWLIGFNITRLWNL